MKLKPMGENILLKQREAAETTISGIVLATATKEKPAIYEVVAIGSKVDAVAAGDKVVVSKHTRTYITLHKVDYKFDKQEELLAVVED